MAPLRIRTPLYPRLTLRVNRGLSITLEWLREEIGLTESVSDAASVTGLEAHDEQLILGEVGTSAIFAQRYAESLVLNEVAVVVVGARSDRQETLAPMVEATASAWAQRESVGEVIAVGEAASSVLNLVHQGTEVVSLQESRLDSAWTNRVEVAAESFAIAEVATSQFATARASIESLALAETRADVAALAGGVLAESPAFGETVAVRMQIQENRLEVLPIGEVNLSQMQHLEGGPFIESEVDWLTPANSGSHWTEELSEVIPLEGSVPSTDAMDEAIGLAENRADQLALTLAFAEAFGLAEDRTDTSGVQNAWEEHLSEYIPLAGGSYVENLSEFIPLGS